MYILSHATLALVDILLIFRHQYHMHILYFTETAVFQGLTIESYTGPTIDTCAHVAAVVGARNVADLVSNGLRVVVVGVQCGVHS